MSSIEIFANALLASLALVMFGLGLSLTTGDFVRVVRYPVPVVVAIVIQLIVLPAVCAAIIVGFDISPVFAVGMMILAASPGGISANLFSHLFGGNVAMNITVTAVNTIVAVASIPLIVNLAIHQFATDEQVVPLQFGKLTEVILMIVIPVILGMITGARWPALKARMEKPVKVFSAAVLVIVVLASIASEWSDVVDNLATLGVPVLIFNLAALGLGYALSRGARLDHRDATAISFEVGIHNSTLAIFVAVGVLGDVQLALPTAVYSVVMYVTAPLFGVALVRLARQSRAQRSVVTELDAH
ncbi:bile acid:sodium symporter family protein [Gordonia sp. NPDC003376]